VLCLQALPHQHPIVKAVAADRAARQAAAAITPEQLKAAAARTFLHQDHAIVDSDAVAAGASHKIPVAPTPGSDGQDRNGGAHCAELVGLQASSGGDLLFCGKHWLLQVDQKTGEEFCHIFSSFFLSYT
jgi:hypothetical protein